MFKKIFCLVVTAVVVEAFVPTFSGSLFTPYVQLKLQSCLGRASTLNGRRLFSRIKMQTALEVGFDTWLEKNGARMAAKLSEANKILICKQDVKAGTELCSIPLKSCFTLNSAKETFGTKAQDMDPDVAIALQLLVEKSKGPKSLWHQWISLLPTRNQIDAPLFWNEEELNYLEGSPVQHETKNLRNSLSQTFNVIRSSISQIEIIQSFDAATFEWAVGLVRSRAVRLPSIAGGRALVPALDMALHIAGGGLGPGVVYEGLFREARVRLVSGFAARAGTPVGYDFECSPGELLFRHGYADLSGREAGDPSLEVTFSLPQSDRFFDDKMDILEQAGLVDPGAEAAAARFVLVRGQPPSDKLLAWLRLVCLKGTDAFLLESIFRGDIWGFMQLPVSRDNESQLLENLENFCESVLQQYTTSEFQDQETMTDSTAPRRARMAAAVKLSERKVLRSVLVWVYDHRSGLEGLDYYQERRLKSLNLDRPIDEGEIVE